MADGPSGTEVMHWRMRTFYRAPSRKQRCAAAAPAVTREGVAGYPPAALRSESISRAVKSRHDPRGRRPRRNGPSRVRVSRFTL